MVTNENIHAVLRTVRRLTRTWSAPVVSHYSETPFTVLISCILSLRTQDKTTDAASERLFKLAKTPDAMRRLPVQVIQKAIYPVGFYRNKAKGIRRLCELLMTTHNGRVPEDLDTLVSLPGVGRKTANLVVTLGFHKPGICVDTHVHRICNRWGYVRTTSPDDTEAALRRKLPPRYWIPLNDWLVTFGQNMCVPISPFCSRCPLRPVCPRRGVTLSR